MQELSIMHDKVNFEFFTKENPSILNLSQTEQFKKFRQILNPDTYFFREKRVLEIFKSLVLPSFPRDKIVRVASVGCSVGKELYSFLLSNWSNKDRIQIEGYDSNQDHIQKAIKGDDYTIYTLTDEKEEFRKLDLDFPGSQKPYYLTYANYTTKVSFTDETKKRVKFSQHDIFENKLPAIYDVVMLMNVLLHYPEKGRDKILTNLFNSINDNGWLLCESVQTFPSPNDYTIQYHSYMKDISRLGFEKQTIILKNWVVEDQTRFSQVYKKRSMSSTK